MLLHGYVCTGEEEEEGRAERAEEDDSDLLPVTVNNMNPTSTQHETEYHNPLLIYVGVQGSGS